MVYGRRKPDAGFACLTSGVKRIIIFFFPSCFSPPLLPPLPALLRTAYTTGDGFRRTLWPGSW